jgi:hypothetical protein
MVVEDKSNGNKSCHFLMEGLGRTLVAGAYDDTVLDRLRWSRMISVDAASARKKRALKFLNDNGQFFVSAVLPATELMLRAPAVFKAARSSLQSVLTARDQPAGKSDRCADRGSRRILSAVS